MTQRDNFRHRISIGRLSPQGAQIMWENAADDDAPGTERGA
jgi:hypothetical protein